MLIQGTMSREIESYREKVLPQDFPTLSRGGGTIAGALPVCLKRQFSLEIQKCNLSEFASQSRTQMVTTKG